MPPSHCPRPAHRRQRHPLSPRALRPSLHAADSCLTIKKVPALSQSRDGLGEFFSHLYTHASPPRSLRRPPSRIRGAFVQCFSPIFNLLVSPEAQSSARPSSPSRPPSSSPLPCWRCTRCPHCSTARVLCRQLYSVWCMRRTRWWCSRSPARIGESRVGAPRIDRETHARHCVVR